MTTIGMLQLLAIAFDSDEPRGRIIPEFEALQKQGLIRLVDLVFITKGGDGTAGAIEISDLTEQQRIELGAMSGDWPIGGNGNGADPDLSLGEEDIEEIASEMPNNSSALIVFVEHMWSIPFKQATLDAGGRLLGNWIIQTEMLGDTDSEIADQRQAQPVS